ncbi:acyltransferase [Lachnospiraceae bacterium OttesenSCG-928-D06]|nr:acyltransferase [Lachnospiraceae bacterium OttesenSCG-928-D06]
MVNKKERMANIELLRILAMTMVVMLHYLGKGNLLPNLTEEIKGNGYLAWSMEILCIVAVNVYMLISGYFLVESGFKWRRLVKLLCQVMFYTLLIPGALILFGVISIRDLTLNQLLQYIFPVQKEHYWFVTAYVLMYLFSPVLSAAVKSMKKRQLQMVIISLLLFLSVSKSILPLRLDMDKLGYDGIWFLCVFLIAAYMRLYGISFYKNGKRGFFLYLLFSGGTLLILFVSHFICVRTGQLALFMETIYGYNHIFNIFAAISLFYAFYYYKLPKGKISKWICKIAPYTFGVYLLHEHEQLRYRWPIWVMANSEGNPLVFLIRSIFSVLLVFAVGVIVDMIRDFLFRLIGKLLKGSFIDRKLSDLDSYFAEEKS